MDDIFAEAKQLSLVNFLEQQFKETAVKVGGGYRFKTCPDCGTGSQLRIHIHNDVTWKCFSCHEKGTIVDAAALLWGCSIPEAAKSLINKDTNKVVNIKVRSKEPEGPSVNDIERANTLTIFLKKLREATKNLSDPKILDYLINVRCFSKELLEESRNRGSLGFLPSNPAEALKLILSISSREELEKAGIWKVDSKMPGICFRPIVFFMPGCASAEFRILGKPRNENECKSIRYGKTQKPYFWRGKEGSTRILVTEGYLDHLAAVELGWKEHVMGLPGTGTWELDWFLKCLRVYEIEFFVIGFDNDIKSDGTNPGQESALKLIKCLNENDIKNINKPPLKGDINDFLIESKSIKLRNAA